MADATLRQLAVDFGSQLVPTIRNVWIDLVNDCPEKSGLGNHFDTSDNFTIQIRGTKRWQLQGPTEEGIALARKHLALRLPATPILQTESEVFEFVVHEGEMLYIPLFWMHDGVATSDSQSASFVLNAESWIDAVYFLCWHIADLENWSYPLPRVPRGESTNISSCAAPEIIGDLVSALRSTSFCPDRMMSEWYKSRSDRMIGEPK